MKLHRVWAEINLNAIDKNIQIIRSILRPQTQILAVVKADAYGHGAVPVAWRALESGAQMLGVGDSTEAIQLREAGITGPILILGVIIEEEIAKVVEYDIAITVHSIDMLTPIHREAKLQKKQVPLHLKVDTGMGRLGASADTALQIARLIVTRYPYLRLEGVCTHLSSVLSANKGVTQDQLARFNTFLKRLYTEGIYPRWIHVANSAGLLATSESHFSMVRLGIALYGMDPGFFAIRGIRLCPVLTLKSQIAYLKTVDKGTYIGYERRYQAPSRTRIATVPVGYNDGYPYLLSNKANVLIRAQRARIAGTVTMDYIMVDVGHIAGIKTGEEVVLIGLSGQDRIRVEELASYIGTIPYEITCAIGRRVKRVYINGQV